MQTHLCGVALEQNNIDIQRIECNVGTRITIQLDDERLNQLKTNDYDIFDYSNHNFRGLKWDEWYWFDYPVINYYIDEKKLTNNAILFQSAHLQGQQNVWFEYKGNYESIRWSYKWTVKSAPFSYNIPEAFCNGIAIPNIYHYYPLVRECGLMVEMPTISVIDKQSKLRLSLSRHCLLEIPDGKFFVAEIYKYIIAQLLISDFSDAEMTKQNFLHGFKYNYNSNYSYATYVFSKNGYTLFSIPFLVCAAVNRCFILCVDSSIKKPAALLNKFNAPFCAKTLGNRDRMNLDFYKDLFNGNFFSNFGLFDAPRNNNDNYYGKNQYIFKQNLLNWYNEKNIFNDIINKLPQYFINKRVFIDEKSTCIQNCYNKQYENKDMLIETNNLIPTILEYEIITKSITDSNLMIDIIKEYLGEDVWIPFDMNERKKKFPKAFKNLEKYMVNMDHHRNPNI